MMNTTNIVRCCESNVQDSKVCYHFNSPQEFKSKLTMVRMNPKPKKNQKESKSLATGNNGLCVLMKLT